MQASTISFRDLSRPCGPDGFTHDNQSRCLPFTECLIWQLLEDKSTRSTYGTKYWFHGKVWSSLVFLLLPKNMLWKLTGWSLTMVEVDCQSFSGVPFFKKIQAHNTSQRLYLDYISKRQICCKHAELSCIMFGTRELIFVPICVFSICCADFHPILFRGGHIHFVGLYLSISACNKHPNILKFQL